MNRQCVIYHYYHYSAIEKKNILPSDNTNGPCRHRAKGNVQRKTNPVWSHLQVESTTKPNKGQFTDPENSQGAASGGGGRWVDWLKGV